MMDLMNTHTFILNKDKKAIEFNTEGGYGRLKLINLMVDELHGKAKEGWGLVLGKYCISVTKKFKGGINAFNGIGLTTLMQPVQDTPIFAIQDEFLFGETKQGEHTVIFNGIEFSISTYDGKPLEHTFRFVYENTPNVKEVKNHSAVGIGLQ